MNIQILNFLVLNTEYIERKASEEGLNSEASLGVVRQLIGSEGDVSVLSTPQRHHYNKVIQPLIMGVPCEGAAGWRRTENNLESTCVHSAFIEEENLLDCYEQSRFKCSNCMFDANNHGL